MKLVPQRGSVILKGAPRAGARIVGLGVTSLESSKSRRSHRGTLERPGQQDVVVYSASVPSRVSLLAIVLAVTVPLLASTPSAFAAPACPGCHLDAALAADVAEAVVTARRAEGLLGLSRSRELAKAARYHALESAGAGVFSHSSPDGSPSFDRIARFYKRAGSKRWAVAETMAWARRPLSAELALSLWLRSDTHREILLSPRFREIGVAAVHADGAGGVFAGEDVTIVVVEFGRR